MSLDIAFCGHTSYGFEVAGAEAVISPYPPEADLGTDDPGGAAKGGCRVPYTDKTLTCQDCGQSFSFSADDQEFFAQKGFSEPKRCPNCRRARKNERDGGGGGGGYGGGARQLYPATCANCGKETEVPFQPRGDRPVYCRDCFESVRPKRY
jgi:CxxC-x17-CxxC domain-containing protein